MKKLNSEGKEFYYYFTPKTIKYSYTEISDIEEFDIYCEPETLLEDFGLTHYLCDFGVKERTCPVCGDGFSGKPSNRYVTCKRKCSRVFLRFRMKFYHNVENASQLKSSKDKFKETIVSRTDIDRSIISKKRHDTNLERYGESYAKHSPEFIEKLKIILSSKEVKDKRENTCLERYGFKNPMQNSAIQEKSKRRTIEIHGRHPFNDSETRERATKTRLENGYFSDELTEKLNEANRKSKIKTKHIDIEKSKRVVELLEQNKPISEIEDIMGHKTKKIYDLIPSNMKNKDGPSIPELSVKDKLEELTGISFKSSHRKLFPNSQKEIDIFSEEHKIAIEFNGIYWHKDSFDADKWKAVEARGLGYKFFAVNEIDLVEGRVEKIAALINPNRCRLFARKCSIKKIKNPKEFLEEHHLQGSIPAPICYGLFHGSELVQVMTFGKPRFNDSYDFEIIRLVSSCNVVGGAERLFKHFTKTHKGSIISYSDNRWFDGSIYGKLGFELLRENSPGYIWMHKSSGQVYSRYQAQRHKLNELFNVDFDKEFTAENIMTAARFMKVHDLGQKVWVLE